MNVVSQCANPCCRAPFLYLRDGKLFAVPRRNARTSIEYFWLCGSCALEMDLHFSLDDHLPALVPKLSPQQFLETF
ncbi:MAG: hypothetical protein LAO20_13085 [Acidobacteriia bacterium]|nr:hypothetical protein [Terriglobia bacterium]